MEEGGFRTAGLIVYGRFEVCRCHFLYPLPILLIWYDGLRGESVNTRQVAVVYIRNSSQWISLFNKADSLNYLYIYPIIIVLSQDQT